MLSFLLTFLAAVSLSLAAAYYSIVGLVAIFSGSVLAITLMAGAMEYGKIITAVWLHKHWKEKHGLLKWYLTFAVFVLMIITSMGIYGFLSKSYLESAGNVKQDYVQREYIEKQISLLDENIERNEKIISQLDAAVDQYIQLNRITKGLKQRELQKDERNAVNAEITNLRREKESLTQDLLASEKRITEIEVEVGPVKYISELIYGKEKAQESLDDAVRWVIFLLIFVFDPLAILLMIASQISYEQWKKDKERKKTVVEKPAEAVNFEHAVPEPDTTTEVEEPVMEEVPVDTNLTEEQKELRERIMRKKERSGSASKTM